MKASFDKRTIEKIIKAYNSVTKEEIAGNGRGWAFLGKFGVALSSEGVSYKIVNGESVKLRQFVECTDLFEITETHYNRGVQHYIRLKKDFEDGMPDIPDNQALDNDAQNNSQILESIKDNTPETTVEEVPEEESPDILEIRSLFENDEHEEKEAETEETQLAINTSKHAIIPEESLKLFNILRETKQDDWKTFSKRDYVGVWRSIIEKYPETAHFIYELLQNADDALATEASILLCKDKLIFKHNGQRQFTLTDANETDGRHQLHYICCMFQKKRRR